MCACDGGRTRKQEAFVRHTPPPFPTCLPGDERYDAEEEEHCPATEDAALNLRTGQVPGTSWKNVIRMFPMG